MDSFENEDSCLVFLYERFLLLLFGKDETTVTKIWQFLRSFCNSTIYETIFCDP